MNYGFGSYRRTDIQTADRRKVIVLLYEGAIANLNKALACMQAGEFQQMSIFINKTLDIVKFLDNALDMSQGGEIAANLRNLYVFMRDTLMRANIDKDSESIDTVIGLFGTCSKAGAGFWISRWKRQAPIRAPRRFRNRSIPSPWRRIKRPKSFPLRPPRLKLRKIAPSFRRRARRIRALAAPQSRRESQPAAMADMASQPPLRPSPAKEPWRAFPHESLALKNAVNSDKRRPARTGSRAQRHDRSEYGSVGLSRPGGPGSARGARDSPDLCSAISSPWRPRRVKIPLMARA